MVTRCLVTVSMTSPLSKQSRASGPLGPLRPKFDRATQAFLKIEMRHGAHSFHSIRLATFGIFKIDMEIVKRATGAIANGTGIESM